MQQGGGDLDALLVAEGEGLQPGLALLGQAEAFEQVEDVLACGGGVLPRSRAR